MVSHNSQLQAHWKVFKTGEAMSVGMLLIGILQNLCMCNMHNCKWNVSNFEYGSHATTHQEMWY